MPIDHLTPEQRKDALEKSRLSRLAKAAARIGNPLGLKLEYADEAHWDELAHKYGIGRRPSKEDQVDASTIRKWINKLGLTPTLFNEHYTGIKYFVQHNPTWTKFAVIGLLLELKDSLTNEAVETFPFKVA